MSLALLVTGGLVMARLGGVIMVLPGFSATGMPALVRLAIAVSLTVLIAPAVPQHTAEPTLPVLLTALTCEVGLGVLLGSVVSLVFGGLVFAMEIMGTQTGRAMGMQFNPMLKMSQGPLGILAGMMATLVFLGMGLHLAVLVILADSFYSLPVGSAIAILDVASIWVDLIEPVLKTGLQLAGPVLALVFLVNSFVAALAKLAPSMNVFFSIGLILTMISGTWLIYLLLPHLLDYHMHMVMDAIAVMEEMIEIARGASSG